MVKLTTETAIAGQCRPPMVSVDEPAVLNRFSAKIRYGKIISSLPFVTSGKARHLEVVKTD